MHQTDQEEDFLSTLAQTAETHGYQLERSTSENPDIILIGDYHPENLPWMADNIEGILRESIKPGEHIFMEGQEGKIIYPLFNMKGTPISDIKELLEAKGIESYFNDSSELLKKQGKNQDQLQHTFDNELLDENRAALDESKRLIRERDGNFVNGYFGLAKHQGRCWQIVGEQHITDGDLVKLIEEKGLKYAIITPTERPTDNQVRATVHALETLQNGTTEAKCEAIKAIRKVSYRPARLALNEAMTDRSGRVRKFAAQALGFSSNQKAISTLLNHVKDPDPLTRWTVHRALSRFDDSRIGNLAQSYMQSDKEQSWTYAALLMHKHLYEQSLLEMQKAAVQNENPFIRALSVRVLVDKNQLSTIALENLLNEIHPAVREEAVYGLKRVAPEILESRDWSKEEDCFVRAAGQGSSPITIKSPNKVRGSLIAVAIGDALGAPVEGLHLQQITAEFGKVTDYVENTYRRGANIPTGSITDDTELTGELMDWIISGELQSPYALAQRFGSIGKRIDDDFDQNRGYGYNTLMVFRQLYTGVNWRFTGASTGGCGAAMRVAPIAALDMNDETLLRITETQGNITHQDPTSLAAANAMCYATSRAYELKPGFDTTEFLDDVAKQVEPLSQKVADEIRNVKKYLQMEPEEAMAQIPLEDSEPKRKGKGALGTVSSAIYCFLRTPDNIEQTLITTVNTSGDSDSIAAMAGMISGAFNGYDAIPKRWITGLYEKERIKERVERFSSQ